MKRSRFTEDADHRDPARAGGGLGDGGWGGIRTHGALARTAVFKTAALNHSATHPARRRRTLAIGIAQGKFPYICPGSQGATPRPAGALFP